MVLHGTSARVINNRYSQHATLAQLQKAMEEEISNHLPRSVFVVEGRMW